MEIIKNATSMNAEAAFGCEVCGFYGPCSKDYSCQGDRP